MNIIDKVVELFSPESAFRREAYRNGLKELRSYDAAKQGRLGSDWLPVNGTAENVDRYQRDIIRGRARNLEMNSDLAEGIVSAIVRNVVGTGIKPQAKVRTKRGKLDETNNKALEEAWKQFIKAKNCDASGHNTFYELQAMAMHRLFYDGEVLVNKITDKEARVPLALQMIEPERLGSHQYQTSSGNYILSGVEVTDTLRPVAYWIFKMDPFGFQTYEAERYSADRMIHIYVKNRATQTRGISMLARVMSRINDLDEFLEADLVAARVAACFAVFVTSDEAAMRAGKLPTKDGTKVKELGPGLIEHLRPGEKVDFAEPDRNASTSRDYAEILSRKAATGVGVSYDIVTRDITGNFSAARQNLLEDRKTFEPLQQFLINHFCQPIWEEFVTACYLKGILKAPDFLSSPEKYMECTWVTPGWAWIDPEKEVKAYKEALRAGMTTLADVCGSQGKDYEEVLEQRAEELGLELDIDMIPGLSMPAQEPEKGDGKVEPTEES